MVELGEVKVEYSLKFLYIYWIDQIITQQQKPLILDKQLKLL